jgi:hypothetical protein
MLNRCGYGESRSIRDFAKLFLMLQRPLCFRQIRPDPKRKVRAFDGGDSIVHGWNDERLLL